MTVHADRWYQTGAIDALFNYFQNNSGNPLICLPTGAGKSRVQARFLEIVLQMYPNQRVLCLTHVKELVKNNHKTMHNVWANAPAGIYSAGLHQRDLHYPITFGSVKSVANVIFAFGHIDLLLIDEAHLLGDAADSKYQYVIRALRERNPYLKVIGLTATRWRTGMGCLTNGSIFTDVAYDICDIPGFRRLFDENYLVPPRAKKTTTEIDVSEIKITAGEFSQAGLQQVTKNEKITWAALQESLNKGHDRNCRLVFCSGVDHAILATDMMRHLGVNARCVHSRMPDTERDAIFKAYFANEFDTLVNNGIATTGIDHPPIDHIIMLRPTMSAGLWVQMLGRGTRPYDLNGWHKQDCLVTDHGGNARRLGTIDDPYIPKLKGKGTGDAPVKLCPACGTYNHARAAVCDCCGEPFETKVGFKKTSFDDALVRSDLPVYETYKVDHVFYTQYLKKAATSEDKPVLKAVYRCGMQSFTEFVALEAAGFGGKRAREWWRQRFPAEGFLPSTVNDAMRYVDKLLPPKTIKVWVNRKWPEIVEAQW